MFSNFFFYPSLCRVNQPVGSPRVPQKDGAAPCGLPCARLACSARLGHGAALSALRRSAHSALPPPPPSTVHLHLNQRRNRTTRGERRPALDRNPRTPSPAGLVRHGTQFKNRSLPEARPARQLAASSAAPRRAAPVACPPPGEQFIPRKLDEFLDSCEEVREES